MHGKILVYADGNSHVYIYCPTPQVLLRIVIMKNESKLSHPIKNILQNFKVH